MSNLAAQRYAKAVLNLAKDQDKTTEVNEQMHLLSKTLSENKNLLEALKNPTLKLEEKRKSLFEIFKDMGAIPKGLFAVLLDNKRIDIIDIVAKQYILAYNELNHIQTAMVTTAVPMTDEIEKKVLEKVKELTDNEAAIENKVDEDILGGFVLRIGDLQYNASVAGNLARLKREFKKNYSPGKFKSNGVS